MVFHSKIMADVPPVPVEGKSAVCSAPDVHLSRGGIYAW